MDINTAEGWFAAELDTAYSVPAVAVEVVGSEEKIIGINYILIILFLTRDL